MDKNRKVPRAILSCFLILFIIQGILKISGVFVFEKALYWQIFTIIDNTKWLQIIYYTLLNCVPIYCLSFAFTDRPYSKKWYHYVLIVGGSLSIIMCRMFIKTPMFMEFIYDIIIFVLIPLIINMTTDFEHKLSKDLVLNITIQILLYFVYLGLSYWSNLLSSMIPVAQTVLSASCHFLVQFEMYIGLISFMLAINLFIKGVNMNWPLNIASTIAKKKAKREKLSAEIAKLDKEIAELESK